MRGLVAGQHRGDVIDDHLPHGQARLAGGAAQVRQQHDVVQPQQARVQVGLLLVDIEPGGANPARGQGLDQSFFLDDGPARGVDEHGAALHHAQVFGVQQVVRVLGQGYVQADKITLAQQALEIDLFVVGLARDLAAGCSR